MVGNIPNFVSLDVVRCFLLLKSVQSRAALMERLGLGEGTVRSILNILKDNSITASTKKGHFLDEEGIKMHSKIMEIISAPQVIEYARFYPYKKKSGIVVKKWDELVKINANLRDTALKWGAEGAMIFAFDKKLYIPGLNDDFSDLESKFELPEKCFVVIGFSNTARDAENGALAVALEMNSELKQLFSRLC